MTTVSFSNQRAKTVALRRLKGLQFLEDTDFLAAEEPLEIRVNGQSVAVVMRTPGEDAELAAGFLVTEGLVQTAGDLIDIRTGAHCLRVSGGDRRGHQQANGGFPMEKGQRKRSGKSLIGGNVIDVRLRTRQKLDLKKLSRHLFSSSSCGICSKASIQAVRQQFPPLKDCCEVEAEIILRLPHVLASAQETFKRTGGLHACALFDLTGKLLVIREDVGRHNALDKLVGWALLSERLRLREHILLLSGRISFEMVQKSLAAGIPIVAAISAPSSLAVEFAEANGQTLIGFVRGDRMNIYSGTSRISG